jgi:hypothetical protein
MAASELRTVLLATHVAVLEEPEADSGDGNDGNGTIKVRPNDRPAGILRLRILAWLFENRYKTGAVLPQLLQRREDKESQWIGGLAELALDGKWDEAREAATQVSWKDLRKGIEAWLDAEREVADGIGDLIDQAVSTQVHDRGRVARTFLPALIERSGDVGAEGLGVDFEDQPVEVLREEAPDAVGGRAIKYRAETGTAARATSVVFSRQQYEPVQPPPSLPALMKEVDEHAARRAAAYLWGPTQSWEVDVDRIKNQIEQKRMLVTAALSAAVVEPVGYLHLEKLFFEPEGLELGELVQTIPLMPGETRRFTHSEWSNSRSEYSKLVTESLEKLAEQSLSETAELTESTNAESSRDLAFSLAASVSGSYGTVNFGVTTGLNINQSESQSRQTSAAHSREVTEKASSRSKQERKVEFHFTTEEGTSDVAFQEVTNQGDEALTWAYHRMMTKWKVTLARYGVRLTYDLVVPDPANRLLRAYQRLFDLRQKLSTSEGFTLSPTAITRYGWPSVAAQYGVPIDPPPPESVAVVAAANHAEPDAKRFEAATLSLTAGTGYVFNGGWSAQWWANGYGYSSSGWPSIDPMAGQNASRLAGASGTFPWEYNIHWPRDTSGGAAYIQVRAGTTLTPEAYQAWQTNSWEKAHDAYLSTRERQRGEWRRELDELEGSLGDVDALTLRKKEQEEVMRTTLAWLVGPTFDFYPDVLPAPSDILGPDIGLYNGEGQVLSDFVHEAFLRHGELVEFLHQAVEWENLIYVVYPYFWTHEKRWDPKDDVRHPDFVRQTFLRAGAARVVLTIRPGFETAFLAYVTNAGLNQPLPANHPYVTVAEELRNLANTSYPYTPAANPPNPANIVDYWYEYTPTGALFLSELQVP